MKMYRLIFSDGSHGAWEKNFEYIKEKAKFFNTEIETQIFNF